MKKGDKSKPEKAPKPAESLASIGRRTKAIHDDLHGRKPKGK
jgi:hypothetical protein